MNRLVRLSLLLTLCLGLLPRLLAQGNATDARAIQLYGFGGISGVYTGLDSGRNLGITAGVDLGFGGYRGFLPMLELRGRYPVDNGTIVGERDFLGGLRVERQYRSLHPYADVLFGRGQLQYQGIGLEQESCAALPVCTYYQITNSNIFAAGGGVDLDVTDSIAVKADVQFEHWNTPVTTSGDIYSTAITIGGVYRFGYRQRRIY